MSLFSASALERGFVNKKEGALWTENEGLYKRQIDIMANAPTLLLSH